MTPSLTAWLVQVKARRQSASLGDTVSFLRSAGDVPALVKIVEAALAKDQAWVRWAERIQPYGPMDGIESYTTSVREFGADLAAAIKEATDGH